MIEKFILKYGFNYFCHCLGENINPIALLKDQLTSLKDTDTSENKRLIIYTYCNVLREIYNRINYAELFEIIVLIIDSNDSFYKLQTSEELPLDFTDQYSYSANTSPKLSQCEMKVS